MHHLQEIEGMSLKAAQYCVFDEADRLFEMGFAEQLKAILTKMSQSRQTLLFSATLPAALAEFARAGLKDPEFVRLDADNKLSADLSLAFFNVRCVHWAPTLNPDKIWISDCSKHMCGLKFMTASNSHEVMSRTRLRYTASETCILSFSNVFA